MMKNIKHGTLMVKIKISLMVFHLFVLRSPSHVDKSTLTKHFLELLYPGLLRLRGLKFNNPFVGVVMNYNGEMGNKSHDLKAYQGKQKYFRKKIKIKLLPLADHLWS